MTYNPGIGRWEIPSIILGTALPTGSRTYNFSASTAGNPVIGSVTVSVYVEQFATGLQPTGNVGEGHPTFTWTGFDGVTGYEVTLRDNQDDEIWFSPELGPAQTSVVYDGPDLVPLQVYRYTVISMVNTDGNSNASFAEAEFTYTPSATPGDLNNDGNVNLADAIIGLQVIAGMNPTIGPLNPDVNGDDKIGLVEVIYALQVVSDQVQP